MNSCAFCHESLPLSWTEIRDCHRSQRGDGRVLADLDCAHRLRFCNTEHLQYWVMQENPADLNYPPEMAPSFEEVANGD